VREHGWSLEDGIEEQVPVVREHGRSLGDGTRRTHALS